MMSEGLESEIQLEDERENRKGVTVKIDGRAVNLQFISVELTDDHLITLCVDCFGKIDSMINALLEKSNLPVTLSGKEFKSQVLKVESGRCYLRLLR